MREPSFRRRALVKSCGIAVGGIAGLSGKVKSVEANTTQQYPLLAAMGGLHLLPEAGTDLEVTIQKRERPTPNNDRMDVRLISPDRNVLQWERITKKSKNYDGWGPIEEVTVSTHVDRKGHYMVQVLPVNKFGLRTAWSFDTNCDKYMIEYNHGSSHNGGPPIRLWNPTDEPNDPLDIWFRPRDGDIRMWGPYGFPSSVMGDYVTVYDAEGNVLKEFYVGGDGNFDFGGVVPQQDAPEPWRLHLPEAEGAVHIDGLTTWGSADPDQYKTHCLWTPEKDSWFPIYEGRQLIKPEYQPINNKRGERDEQKFSIYNFAPTPQSFALSLEFPDYPWAAHLSESKVHLGGGESTEVTVNYTTPGIGATVHLRATSIDNPEFSTYATLTTQTGNKNTYRPLSLPVRLKPFDHERTQLNYRPDYPTDWQMQFDRNNRPSVRTERGIKTLRDGEWELSDFTESVSSSSSVLEDAEWDLNRRAGLTRIAFDGDNDYYHFAQTVDGEKALLHSTDEGRTWTGYHQDWYGGLETFTGHNDTEHPPYILVEDEAEEMDLIPLYKTSDGIEFGDRHLLTDSVLAASPRGAHSGIPQFLASSGSLVHVVWYEESSESTPGAPCYARTWDRDSESFVGEPVFIGYAGNRANDSHNSPSIALDSEGYLHVVLGAHNNSFRYTRTKEPNNAHTEWTEPTEIAEIQTYVGLVCDQNDTLHMVSREYERTPPQTDAEGIHSKLVYHRKPTGEPWEPRRDIVHAPLHSYSVWYHRLNLDRAGRLMLSYDHWSRWTSYRNYHRQPLPQNANMYRKTAFSDDGGDSWNLLKTADFEP